jgi:hypothetical protein
MAPTNGLRWLKCWKAGKKASHLPPFYARDAMLGIGSDNLIGLGLVVLATVLMVFFTLPLRGRKPAVLRPMPAVRRLQRAIGLAVEQGKRLHLSLGRASIVGPNVASALVGLSTLERIGEISVISDQPPVATSGDGALALLSQNTLHAAYRAGNASDLYEADRGRLAGTTAFSYAAGAAQVVRSEDVSANILIGSFGPEVALMTEASDRQPAFSLAASDSLPAQAVLFATADETLIGEELFALPAYLQATPAHTASLHVQDIFRWILIVLLFAGAVLKLFSSLLGLNF